MLANREICSEGVSHHHFSQHLYHHHHHHHATQPLICRADPRGCTANAANSGSAFAKTPRPPPPPPLAPSRTTKKGKHLHPIAHSGATAYPTPHMPQPTRHDRHAQRHQLSLSLSVSLPLFLSTAGAAVLGQGSLPLAPTAACPGSASILSVGTTWA